MFISSFWYSCFMNASFLFSFPPSISGRYNKQFIPYFGSECREDWWNFVFSGFAIDCRDFARKTSDSSVSKHGNMSYFFGSLIISCLVFLYLTLHYSDYFELFYLIWFSLSISINAGSAFSYSAIRCSFDLSFPMAKFITSGEFIGQFSNFIHLWTTLLILIITTMCIFFHKSEVFIWLWKWPNYFSRVWSEVHVACAPFFLTLKNTLTSIMSPNSL